MKFKINDRVRIHDIDQTTGKYTTDKATVLAVKSNRLKLQCDVWNNKQPWYASRQCRLLKPPKYKLNDKVYVEVSWSKWVLNHIDVYFIPGKENAIPEQHMEDLELHCSQVNGNYRFIGKVVGFGNDDSYRVHLEHNDKSYLIGPEDLRRYK